MMIKREISEKKKQQKSLLSKVLSFGKIEVSSGVTLNVLFLKILKILVEIVLDVLNIELLEELVDYGSVHSLLGCIRNMYGIKLIMTVLDHGLAGLNSSQLF